MGPGEKRSKNNFIFSKVFKLFTHRMGCFGTGLGMLFHLYKGVYVTQEVFEKIKMRTSLYVVNFILRFLFVVQWDLCAGRRI